MIRLPSARSTAALLSLALVTACGGSDRGGDNIVDGGTGTISLALSSDSVKLRGLAPATFTATITRGGNFTGPVQLAVTGIGPTSSATVSILPNPIPAGATTSVVTITETPTFTGSDVINFPVPGPFVVSASASAGVTPDSKTAQLLAGLAPLGLTVTPSSLTIQSGSSGTATLAFERASGTQFLPVALFTFPPPTTGITATYSPSETTIASSSNLTRAVAATVPPGVYTVLVSTGQLLAEQTNIALPITVTR